MTLSRPATLVLGALTLWPPLYVLLFMAFVATAVFSGGPIGAQEFSMLFVAHFATMVIGFAVLVVYVLHALKNPRLDSNQRLLWALMMFVGSFLAMPIYFVLQVWPEHDEGPSA